MMYKVGPALDEALAQCLLQELAVEVVICLTARVNVVLVERPFPRLRLI
jgi:hypothetical protein